MRIVHEIHGRAQVGGSVDQYAPKQGESPSGGSCDLVIALDPGAALVTEHGDSVVLDGEVIHIEGDVDDVIDMLLDTLRVIQMSTDVKGFVLKRTHEGFPAFAPWEPAAETPQEKP